MVYKKYIKKGDKLYGPYIYQSKRVDGKVVSEYMGAGGARNYKNFLFILFGLLLVIAIIYVLFFRGEIGGRAVLGIDATYEEGNPLEGNLNLVLKEGELIPASSKIVFENSGQSYEFDLRSLVDEPVSEGGFYVEGTSLSGSGEGYGIIGERIIYPEIQFTMFVYKESDSGQSEEPVGETPVEESASENITEQLTEQTITQETITESNEQTLLIEETPTEETESAPITGTTVKGLRKIFGATGRVSMELEKEIQGTVSKDSPFVYELGDGETAELKPKSVRIGSTELKDNDISFNIEENRVVVTTEYSERSNGYGEDYLGKKEKKISIDLSGLNLSFEEGGLIVRIVYEEEEMISLSTVLEDKKPASNETVPEIPKLNETKNKTEEIINKTLKNITIADMTDFLTDEERKILVSEFGNTSINLIKSEYFKDKIIIYYNFSRYSAEFAYDSSLDDEEMEIQMEKDRIKWMKDIANSLLYEKTAPNQTNKFNSSYNF